MRFRSGAAVLLLTVLASLVPTLANAFSVILVIGDMPSWFPAYLSTYTFFQDGTYLPWKNFALPLDPASQFTYFAWNTSAPNSVNQANLLALQTSLPDLKLTILDVLVKSTLPYAWIALNDPNRLYLVSWLSTLKLPYPPNLIVKDSSFEQASFLAGMMAGMATRVARVGFIGGQDNPNTRRYLEGFQMGVRRVCPTCVTDASHANSFSNGTMGLLIGQWLVARGADVVMGAGGAASDGGLLPLSAAGILVIGTDSDIRKSAFAHASAVQTSNVITTAATYGNLVWPIIYNSILKGTATGGLQRFDTTVDSVGLTYCYDACSKLPPQTWPVINSTYAQLKAQTLSLGIVITAEYDMGLLPAFHAVSLADHYGPVAMFDSTNFIDIAVSGQQVLMIDSSVIKPRYYRIASHNVEEVVLVTGSSPFVFLTLFSAVAFTQFNPNTVLGSKWTAYVIGGSGTDNTGLSRFSDVIHVYDMVNDLQTFQVAMSTVAAPTALKRVNHATVAHPNSTLPLCFVFGGRDYLANQKSDMWALNLTSFVATQMASAPMTLEGHAMAAFTSRPGFNGFATADYWLVVLGGTNLVQGVAVTGLWYNIRLDQWVPFAAASTQGPPTVVRPCIWATNDQIVLVGGKLVSGTASNASWVLTPNTMSWASAPSPNRAYGGTGPLSCASLPSANTLTLKNALPLATNLDHGYITRTVIVPRTALTSAELFRLANPNIVCDYTAGLVVNPLGDGCVACPSGVATPLACQPPGVDNTGKIVGGVIGGVAGLVILLVIVFLIVRRINSRNVANAPKDPKAPFGIAFTDVQSATYLWAKSPQDMADAVEVYQTVVRRHIHRHRGYEVKLIGDAFMVVFIDAVDCVRFCVDLQAALQLAAYPTNAIEHCYQELAAESATESDSPSGPWNGLRVRVGAHFGTGEIKFDDVSKSYDYFGVNVEMAARIESAGHGGQSLVSRSLADACATRGSPLEQLDHVAVHPFPDQHLRGTEFPIDILQVLPSSVSSRQFPPLRTDNNDFHEAHRGSLDDEFDTTADLVPSSGGSPLSHGVGLVDRLARRVTCNVHPSFQDKPSYFLLEHTHAVIETLFSASDARFKRATLDTLTNRWRVSQPKAAQGSESSDASLLLATKVLTTIAAKSRLTRQIGFFSSAAYGGVAPAAVRSGGSTKRPVDETTARTVGLAHDSEDQAARPVVM